MVTLKTEKRKYKKLMQEFKVKLTGKKKEAKGTKTFFFAKPNNFEYLAGQYSYFTLPELKFPDLRGNIRHFTLSSSPTENFLSITVRMRAESGYKITLDSYPKGTEISLRGPIGDFTLDQDDKETQVMIAGGIGITPYRSIIKYLADKGLQNSIHLICSNSIPEEIIFKKELDVIAHNLQNIKVSYTVTKPEESSTIWDGLTGRLDEHMIAKLITDNRELKTGMFWLCGPPQMVQSLEEVLDKLKIPQDRIKIEKFSGY